MFCGFRLDVYRIVPSAQFCFTGAERVRQIGKFPAAGDELVALGACSFAQVVLDYIVPGAADERCVARGANCVFGAAVDVAFVDEVQSGFAGNLVRHVQSCRRSRRLVLQFEIWMKCSEVDGNVRSDIFKNPIGEAADFSRIVIQSRDE